ncbi:MAG: Uma2 family endonuclease [Bacteroidia bacterium]
MGEKALDTFSLDTYIQMEAESDLRYEYYDGLILAMAGGDPNHGKIAVNVSTALHIAIRSKKKDCEIYNSDVKVAINSANRRCYPDISVVCGPTERDSKESRAITNPILIVEILSESTELLDRGEKFRAYRQLPSLREYMLVSQDKALVEVFSLTEDGTWRIQAIQGVDQKVEIPALGIQLNTEDIFYRMEW